MFFRTLTTAALALAALTSAAQADRLTERRSQSFGSGHVEAGLSAEAGLIWCDEGDLVGQAEMMACGANIACLAQLMTNPCFSVAQSAYAKVYGEAGGWIELFGRKESLSAEAYAHSRDGNSGVHFKIRAFGETLLHESRTQIVLLRGASFKKNKSFSVAGVSVKVKGEVGAVIGAILDGGVIDGGAALTTAPFVNAGASAGASAGVACANAGISGSIDVLALSLPTTLSVSVDGSRVDYGVDVDLDWEALSGRIKITGNLCGASASKTIASYDGWSGGYDIWSHEGNVNL